MRLLVSLRSEEEVAAALAGGADIIDAKAPDRGPLGAVTPEVLRAISALVPSELPFSVALGDLTEAAAVRRAVEAASIPRAGPVYLKLGFAGEPSRAGVEGLISAAIGAASVLPGPPVIVPVAYADWVEAGTPSPEDVLDAAEALGARAYLVDTYTKDGKGLLDRLPLERVRVLAERGRAAGLLIALAGSLDLQAIERLAGVADVVGVRGAACVGGRSGRVDAERIRQLRAGLGRPDWQNARPSPERAPSRGAKALR